MATRQATAASERYTRCSAISSVDTGTIEDVGASIAKYQIPKKPSFDPLAAPTTEMPAKPRTSTASITSGQNGPPRVSP